MRRRDEVPDDEGCDDVLGFQLKGERQVQQSTMAATARMKTQMANQQEIGVNASLTVGLALSGSKSSKYILQWALTRFTKDIPKFRLIHVLTQVLAVPTPLGNYIPIDKVRNDIADAYVKDVERRTQEMLLLYKSMCDQNKVEAEVLLIKGNDVPETISNVVAQYQIQVLIVGITTRSTFTRKSSGNRMSSKICKSVPSFCTIYIVSKDGLSSVYSPGLESDSPSAVPKGNHGSSNSEALPDEMSSGSDRNDSSSKPGTLHLDIREPRK